MRERLLGACRFVLAEESISTNAVRILDDAIYRGSDSDRTDMPDNIVDRLRLRVKDMGPDEQMVLCRDDMVRLICLAGTALMSEKKEEMPAMGLTANRMREMEEDDG
jgi:hypothetical protein